MLEPIPARPHQPARALDLLVRPRRYMRARLRVVQHPDLRKHPVEFGPAGAGHHGPEEWVSISSLARYRQALCDFVLQLPSSLVDPGPGLRAVEGGLA